LELELGAGLVSSADVLPSIRATDVLPRWARVGWRFIRGRSEFQNCWDGSESGIFRREASRGEERPQGGRYTAGVRTLELVSIYG